MIILATFSFGDIECYNVSTVTCSAIRSVHFIVRCKSLVTGKCVKCGNNNDNVNIERRVVIILRSTMSVACH